MSGDVILSFVEKQEWLAPVQEAGEELVKKAYESGGEAGQAVKDVLHCGSAIRCTPQSPMCPLWADGYVDGKRILRQSLGAGVFRARGN
ncbi:MAG: hypothetical protein WB992_20280 [Bryobacteraceae bacterium]